MDHGALAILLGVMSMRFLLQECTSGSKTTEETDRKLKIVTTIFPEYDWTRAFLGNGKRM